jgi:hypothetical protein
MSTLISRDCSHQYLIDARLDAIERILMDNRVPRTERSEIVSAVEEQIWELLGSTEAEITRAEVLRVLGSLDPPEAYCGDEPHDRPVRRRLASTERAPREGLTESREDRLHSHRLAPLAIIALVLSLISIPAMIFLPLGATLAFAGAICGVVAVSQISASHGHLRGMWMAIVACAVLGLQFAAVWALLL